MRNSLVVIVIGAMSAGISGAATAQEQTTPTSPAMRGLAAAMIAGKPNALAGFWDDVERRGTPLIEAAAHRDSSLVTFVYRGGSAVRAVRLSSGLNSLLDDWNAAGFTSTGQMDRLVGTDVWYASVVVGRDLRVSYRFAVATSSDTAYKEVLDTLNPRVYRPDRERLRASLLELPSAPPQPWHARGKELGAWRQRKVADSLGRENDVFVYLPAGFDAQRAEPYPVLIGLDSYSFGIGMPGALIMDHLITTQAIPPTVLVSANVPRGTGLDELKTTTGYVADHLLPRLRSEFNVTSNPKRVVIAGTSRRGLIATYTAFMRPDAVANVLTLSGSFYWKPDGAMEYEWLTHRFATEDKRSLRLFVAAGNLETVVTSNNRGHYMLAANRHMRDVLQARGYEIDYWEFAGAHSDLSWQDGLARGLAELLADPSPAR